MSTITWQFQAAIPGGPAFTISQPSIAIQAYDVATATIGAGASGVAVNVQPSSTAGDVVLVILDAHTGAPLRNAVVSFDSTSRISGADTLGRIRFRRVSPGPQRLLVRCPGYYLQRDTITMPSAAGLALLIQMRRRPEPLGDDFQEIPVRKPPNDR